MLETTDQEYRDLAKAQYGSGEIEFDEDAKISVGEDAQGPAGAWVQAWVWVDEPTVDHDDE